MNTNFFNLSERKKRDVLYELLTDNQAEGIISKKELKALNRLIGNGSNKEKLPNIQQRKTLKKKPGKKKEGTKRKMTHYLTEEAFDNLESAIEEIRSFAPESIRLKVSKSNIINQALILILGEFKTKGQKSRLVRCLLKRD